VLINWGTSFNNILGGKEAEVVYHLEIAAQQLLNKGYEIIVYPIWVEDINICRRFVDKFQNERNFILDKVYNAHYLCSIIRACRFTINLKLYADILSSAMHMPFISIAYGLKCYDFAESIDSLALVLNTY
jgi:polysaccharide pyruvyl transferase WcaK-like protein